MFDFVDLDGHAPDQHCTLFPILCDASPPPPAPSTAFLTTIYTVNSSPARQARLHAAAARPALRAL